MPACSDRNRALCAGASGRKREAVPVASSALHHPHALSGIAVRRGMGGREHALDGARPIEPCVQVGGHYERQRGAGVNAASAPAANDGGLFRRSGASRSACARRPIASSTAGLIAVSRSEHPATADHQQARVGQLVGLRLCEPARVRSSRTAGSPEGAL